MKHLMITTAIATFIFTSASSFAGNGNNGNAFSSADTAITMNTVPSDGPFTIMEENAQFPGGEMALEQFFRKNIQYPAIAKQQGIEGEVIVALEIDETGAVTNIEIVQGVGGGCEEEVVRVLTEMPSWKPTNQAGHAVSSRKLFSFTFQF